MADFPAADTVRRALCPLRVDGDSHGATLRTRGRKGASIQKVKDRLRRRIGSKAPRHTLYWHRIAANEREKCVLSSTKIALLFRKYEISVAKSSLSFKTTHVLAKTSGISVHSRLVFVHSSPVFRKAAAALRSASVPLFRARVDAPVQTRARPSRTHRSFVFLPSPFTFTPIPLKICDLHVNKIVILTLHR